MTDSIALSEICLRITKGTTPTADEGGFTSAGINYIKSESLSYDGTIDESKFAFIGDETHQKLRRSQIANFDILYSIAGANLGKCGIVKERFLPANTNQAVAIIRVDSERAYPPFIGYFLRQRSVVENVLGGVAQSAQPNVNLTDIGRFRVPNLPIAQQKTIASILGALDDKIDLNRRMNETLEAMARAIFRDWFVDFGPTRAKMEGRPPYLAPDLWRVFPDRLDDKGKPDGWKNGDLAALANLVRAVVTPTQHSDEVFEHYSLPAFDAGQRPICETGRGILSNKIMVPPGSVLVSKLNPEIARVWLTDVNPAARAIASTEFLVLQPLSDDLRAFVYCCASEGGFRKRMEAMVSGTSKSHQRVSPSAVLSLPLTLPPPEVMATFSKLAAPLLNRLLSNRGENVSLANMRDFLLPKLMSGEFRIREAETMMAAVA